MPSGKSAVRRPWVGIALTIARSRKHIQKYYRSSMAQIGHFPKRAKSKSIYALIDKKSRVPTYDGLNEVHLVGRKKSRSGTSGFSIKGEPGRGPYPR